MTQFTTLLASFLRGFGSSLTKYPQLILATLLLLAACSDAPVSAEPEVPDDIGTTPVQKESIAGTLIFPGGMSGSSLGDSGEGTFAPNSFNAAEGSFIAGEVIVKFRSEIQLQSLSAQGLSLQRAQTAGLPRTALYHAKGLNKNETLKLVEELNTRPDVAYAELNTIQTIKKIPNDEFYPYQWHYEAMNLPAAWDIEDGTSNSVTVAVVDSGSIPHPDLQDVLLSGYDFVSDPANAADGDGYDPDPTDLSQTSGYHGAHVAGTIAASTNNRLGVAGVSWGAKVVPIRALGNTGGSLFDTANSILWAAGEPIRGVPTNLNPAQVINLSIGGEAPCSRVYQDVFDTVRAKGIVVVAAAGNENTNVGFSQPANCDGVIAVGATGPQNTRAPYSNYGAGVDVMAPGGDTTQTLNIEGQTVLAGVLSTVKNRETGEFVYSFIDGTSMATPHVSGLVALMLAGEPNLDPDTVLARLKASAKPLSASECGRASGSECGAGLVNAAAALGGKGNLPPQPETRDVKTYVVALYCTASCTDFDQNRSRSSTLSAKEIEVPFKIGSLDPGSYLVAAWQDLDGDVMIDDDEPFGQHRVALSLQAGQALKGADIYLEAFTPQAVQSSESSFRAAVENVRSQ